MKTPRMARESPDFSRGECQTITDSNEKYAIAAPADANYVFDVWYGSNRHHESPIDLSTGDITGHDVTMTSPPPGG